MGPSRPNCRAHTLAHPSPSPPYHVDSGWSEARGGGGAAPLLTKLDLSGYSFAISWQTLASISRLFPELEELTLSGVDIAGASGAPLEACTRLPSLAPPRLPPPPPPPTPRLTFPTHLTASPPRRLTPCTQVLPRLRKLRIGSFVQRFSCSLGHKSTGEVGHALRSLFTLAPSLEDLSLTHGKVYMSGPDRKMCKPLPPLPGCDGALELLPASLRRFSLSTMVLNNDDKLALAQLPQLHALTLSECGADARRIATELCQLSPQLSPSRVRNDNELLALPLCGAGEASTSRRDSSGTSPRSTSGGDDMVSDHAHDSVATADESDEDSKPLW